MDTVSKQTDGTEIIGFDPPVFGMLGQKPELVVQQPDDERHWVLSEPNVWYRPLFFDMTTGTHAEILRVRRGGILSRHRHSAPVHGFVLKGSWRYLEHSWVAREGSYVYEPPGEVHTLTVDGDEEMQTFFYIEGPVLYLDEDDNIVAIDDNLTMIEQCRKHYEAVGLGADFVNNFIR